MDKKTKQNIIEKGFAVSLTGMLVAGLGGIIEQDGHEDAKRWSGVAQTMSTGTPDETRRLRNVQGEIDRNLDEAALGEKIQGDGLFVIGTGTAIAGGWGEMIASAIARRKKEKEKAKKESKPPTAGI